MKNQTQRKPTRGKLSLLRQLCNLIPNHLVPQLARAHSVEEKSRTFRPWSHVVSLIYAQLTHALSLNDVCDALGLHAGPLSAIRGATPPSKNALSHLMTFSQPSNIAAGMIGLRMRRPAARNTLPYPTHPMSAAVAYQNA